MAAEPPPQRTGEGQRYLLGLWVVLAGLAAVVIVFALALWRYSNSPQNVVAVVGAATGVIGTLVAAFFGIQEGTRAGAAGRAESEQARTEVTRLALTMASMTPPEDARLIVDRLMGFVPPPRP